MLRLRDIMTTELITLDPNLTIREAMDAFASRHISGAPVVSGGEVIGVVSVTDLVQFAASLPGVPTERQLTSTFLDELADTEAEAAMQPEGEDPSGMFFTELWDDAGATVVERMAAPMMAEWNSLEEHTVSDAMTSAPVHALPPETFVTTAAEYMTNAKIHRVLVMRGRRLLGVVTTTDITRTVAEGKLTAQTLVFDRRQPPDQRGPWGLGR